jgi:hypothetical protein
MFHHWHASRRWLPQRSVFSPMTQYVFELVGGSTDHINIDA